jgi:hypothetical protein
LDPGIILAIIGIGISSIGIGIAIAIFQKQIGLSNTQNDELKDMNKILTKVSKTQEILNNQFIPTMQKLDEKEEEIKETEIKIEEKVPEKELVYQDKFEICMKLLNDIRWKWRTGDVLRFTSEMTSEEFRKFLSENKNKIVKSSIPDKFGNDLYRLRK